MTLESKFRPLPLNLFDLAAILVPGVLWYMLGLASAGLLDYTSWLGSIETRHIEITQLLVGQGTMLAQVAVFFTFALLLGYIQKPIAMKLCDIAVRRVFRHAWPSAMAHGADHPYPYVALHRNRQFYSRVEGIVAGTTGLGLEQTRDLPGHHPLSIAKRILRLYSQVLWEECERLEAEVRLIGGVFLTLTALSGLCIVWAIYELSSGAEHIFKAGAWTILSLSSAAIAGLAFHRARMHEVEYTYLGLLIASKRIQKESTPDALAYIDPRTPAPPESKQC
jgi:hypothetical protein